jgi:hypothetical protein
MPGRALLAMLLAVLIVVRARQRDACGRRQYAGEQSRLEGDFHLDSSR